MTAPYKAVLFDFDFTLGDSSPGICEAFNYALVGVGREPAEAPAIHKLIGHTLQHMFTEVTGLDDIVRYKHFRSLFDERAAEVVTPSTILYAGVAELLVSLRSQDKQLGIISTKYRTRLEEILHRNQLRDHFTVVIGGEDVTNHKPHPEGLHLAIEHLRIQPQEALYVGDTILDAEAAKAAGIAFAAVLTGTTSRETFIAFEPVGIFDNISGLR